MPEPSSSARSASGCAFNVWIDADPDGGFVAYSGFARGCVSQGETIAETLANFADAYAAWSEVRDAR